MSFTGSFQKLVAAVYASFCTDQMILRRVELRTGKRAMWHTAAARKNSLEASSGFSLRFVSACEMRLQMRGTNSSGHRSSKGSLMSFYEAVSGTEHVS